MPHLDGQYEGHGGDYAAGVGGGALSGAGGGAMTGAGIGMMLGGPVGAGLGAGIGAIAGALGGGALGFFGTKADLAEAERQAEALRKAERERKAGLKKAEEEYNEAQETYDQEILQAGAAGRETLKTAMTAKGAQDAVVKQSAMSEANRVAAESGLIGAEKADFLTDKSMEISQKVGASSPAVYQQALGGARGIMQVGAQKAAFGLQQAGQEYNTKSQLIQGKYGADVTQISGQQTGGAGAAVGSALGSLTQVGYATMGAANMSRGAKASPDVTITEGAPLTAEKVGWSTPSDTATMGMSRGAEAAPTPFSDAELTSMGHAYDYQLPEGETSGIEALNLGGRTSGQSVGRQQATALGGTDLGPALAPPNLGESPIDLYGESPRDPLYTPEELHARHGLHPDETMRGFSEGGVAGQSGEEIIRVGEQGPELILNADQTANLASALGAQQQPSSAPQRAMPATSPTRAPTGSQGGAPDEMDPEELLAYLTEMNQRYSGVI